MISDDAAEQFKGSIVRLAVFLRIGTSPVGRFWVGGIGTINIPADAIEAAGGTFSGLGEATGLPAFESLVNGQAQRLDLNLSGLKPELVALAKEEAAEIRGSSVHIGLMGLDENWQQSTQVYWLWTGVADVVRIARAALGGGTYGRTVTISAANGEAFRRRPLLRLWTDAFQKMRSATDRFCDRVAGMALGKTVKWPR